MDQHLKWIYCKAPVVSGVLYPRWGPFPRWTTDGLLTVHSSFSSTLQAGLFVHLYIHPSTLLINNDGGDESSTRGHFDLLGWHRNGCWPARASVRSLCSILPPSCCTMHTSPVFRHSASRPPVSRRLRNPPRGDYLRESFNLVSAHLRQMSQETRGDTCER